MTAPTPEPRSSTPLPLLRSAIWVAIGAIIAAAIVCVIWVLFSPQDGMIARAFFTILLLTAFAGAALFDAHAAPSRPSWYVLASMVGWVVALLVGAFKIWLPMDEFEWSDNPFVRFIEFVAIVLIIRLALLHMRLYLKSHLRHVTTFTRALAIVTLVLVVSLALMLILPLTFPRTIDWSELYWRIVVAITILAAVGTALVPLINALSVPRAPRPPAPAPVPAPYPPQGYGPHGYAPQGYAPQGYTAWPTYVDGVTPLPVLPDGTPDWNAYYTGYPTATAQAIAPVQSMPVPSTPPMPYPATEHANQAEQHDTSPIAPYAPPADAPSAPPTAEPTAPPAPPGGYQGYPPPPPLPRD